MNIIDELQWRGLINQSTDLESLREACENPIALYCGFDPTGDSLHAGHLVPLIMLRRFQNAGHHPIALAGGATGFIGDPRDVGERSMLSEEDLAHNLEAIKGQLRRFIDFDGEQAATMVNNADWTMNMSVIDFLRDVGKNFSLNTMLDRDTVKRRLEGDGISIPSSLTCSCSPMTSCSFVASAIAYCRSAAVISGATSSLALT